MPYIAIAATVLLACRRLLDVLTVGDEEAASLRVQAQRARLVVVAAATLGTAAAVSVTGLIGFVGIIVPHTVRVCYYGVSIVETADAIPPERDRG